MRRFWLVGALFLLASQALGSELIKVKPDAPEIYIVRQGDTLWDISGFYLDVPWLWPKLWSVNPEIENPHLIIRETRSV